VTSTERPAPTARQFLAPPPVPADPQPPAPEPPGGRSWQVRRPPDAVPALSVFVVVLLALPSRFVVGPLGGVGVPAQILGLAAGLWWGVHWLGQHGTDGQLRQPVRTAAFTFLVAVLISYVVAVRRPIGADELNQADRGLLALVAWIAVLLVTMDGITTRAGLDTLLRRLVVMGGAVGALGLLQFFTGQAYTEYLRLPGLSESGALTDVSGREGFFRPMGTALHAIEFGVIMTSLLPLALHYAVADTHRRWAARWLPVVTIAVALPISISRSAILGAAVGMATLLPTWPTRLRRRVLAAGAVLGSALFVVLPGFLGALLSLFTRIGGDPSARSRTDSYTIAWHFITQYPLFGRGVSTFMPAYRILDNQYLATLIEVGVFGLVALLVLLGMPVVSGWRLRDPAAPVSLGPALAAGIAAAALSFALFDALSFPMVSGVLFFLIGAGAALRRLSLEGDGPVRQLP
jgi:polysaccharide biosynthesis protein PslJ